MLKIRVEDRFQKDVKRLAKSGSKDMAKLKEVIKKLVEEEKLAQKYRPHRLSGNYCLRANRKDLLDEEISKTHRILTM